MNHVLSGAPDWCWSSAMSFMEAHSAHVMDRCLLGCGSQSLLVEQQSHNTSSHPESNCFEPVGFKGERPYSNRCHKGTTGQISVGQLSSEGGPLILKGNSQIRGSNRDRQIAGSCYKDTKEMDRQFKETTTSSLISATCGKGSRNRSGSFAGDAVALSQCLKVCHLLKTDLRQLRKGNTGMVLIETDSEMLRRYNAMSRLRG